MEPIVMQSLSKKDSKKEKWSQFTCVSLCLLQHRDAFFDGFRQVGLRLRRRLTRCVGEAGKGLVGGVCHCCEGGGHREGESLSSTWWVAGANRILGINIGWWSKLSKRASFLFLSTEGRKAAPHQDGLFF